MVGARVLAQFRDDVVAFGQPELARRDRGALEQRLRRAEQLERVAVADAVEVDHADDARQLVALLRGRDEAARPHEPDLLGAERDEPDRARVLAADEPLGDPAQPLDARGVVDRTVAPPD